MRSTFALILTMALAAGASAQNLGDYKYFKSEGILDPGVSDATANTLVRNGIASDEPEIVDLTIRALGEYAMHVVNDLPTRYGTVQKRSFSVPGLKPYLIGYWREQHRLSGYNMLAAVQQELGVPEGRQGVDGLTPERLGLAADASPDEIAEAVSARTPAWTMAPQILCALYPADPDVLELVWEIQNTDLSPGNSAAGILRLLNVGRFTASEANTFRIDTLRTPSGGAPEDDLAVAYAVEGLALARPVEAVPYLIAAAYEHRTRTGDVLVVLAGYDDEVLTAYASEVAGLLEQARTARPMGALTEAVSRLEKFVPRR